VLCNENKNRKGFYTLHFNTLKQLRQRSYASFERGADALFTLGDALLCESQARSLVELSQSPCFERQWSSIYQALSHGRINEAALREAWGEALLCDVPADQPVWISVDASSVARPEAETSGDRGIIHICNLPRASKPISVGWQFSTVMLLPETPSSWVGILDQRRISTKETAIEVALAQLQDLLPRLKRPVIILADRWYATADFLRACRQWGCQVLIRLKCNRKLYRAPVRTSRKGRPPLDGPLFQASRPETIGAAEATWMSHDVKGRGLQVSRWSGLHFRQAREVGVQVCRVRREGAKGTKRDPRESGFVSFDDLPITVPLAKVVSSYQRRFSQEHGYRFLKQELLWTTAHVRSPEQFERWSLLVALAQNQLVVARDLGQAAYRPWESQKRPVTPGQVRRVMGSILSQVGTPAQACQPRGKSPGRPPGFHPKPAPHYDVVLKRRHKATAESG
jgi:DDE superfamily endonuclease